jgi:hypothetical protein
MLALLDHVLFPQVSDYHLRFRLLETAKHFPFTADLEFHVLELPKFTRSAAELASGLDVLLCILRHAVTIDAKALPAVSWDGTPRSRTVPFPEVLQRYYGRLAMEPPT